MTLNDALTEIPPAQRELELLLKVNGTVRPYTCCIVRNVKDEHGDAPAVLILSADDAEVQ